MKFVEPNVVNAVQYTGENLEEILACVTAANVGHQRTERDIVYTRTGPEQITEGMWAVMYPDNTCMVFSNEDFGIIFEPLEDAPPPSEPAPVPEEPSMTDATPSEREAIKDALSDLTPEELQAPTREDVGSGE